MQDRDRGEDIAQKTPMKAETGTLRLIRIISSSKAFLMSNLTPDGTLCRALQAEAWFTRNAPSPTRLLSAGEDNRIYVWGIEENEDGEYRVRSSDNAAKRSKRESRWHALDYSVFD